MKKKDKSTFLPEDPEELNSLFSAEELEKAMRMAQQPEVPPNGVDSVQKKPAAAHEKGGEGSSLALRSSMPAHGTMRFSQRLLSGGFWSYFAIFLLVTFAYFATKPLWADPYTAQGICSVVALFSLIALLLFLLMLRHVGRLTDRHFLLALLAAGMLLRVFYMLYTPFTWRGHDIGAQDGTGHYAYIYQLMTTGALPASYDYQFYHPPLMHLLSAGFCKLCSFFTGETDAFYLVDPAKVISCVSSISILITSVKLGRYFKLKKSALYLLTALIAFAPTGLILSASINNDVLMIALMMGAFYRTLRWKDDPSWKNILLLALSIGLAMMTKLSGGLIALFTALVFLYVLVETIRKKDILLQRKTTVGGLFGQFAAFGGLCIPLALWYPVRNLLLFGQSLTYVPRMSETSALYCGDVSILSRFFSFPLYALAETPYCHPFGDSNLWLYTLKCSVFGEFEFDGRPEIYAYLLLLFNLILIVGSLAAMVYVLLRGRKYSVWKRFAPAFLWLILMVSFIQFNLQYPFGCTMDFRYIVPTLFVGAYYLALGVFDLAPGRKKIVRILRRITIASVSLFCASVLLFYFA